MGSHGSQGQVSIFKIITFKNVFKNEKKKSTRDVSTKNFSINAMLFFVDSMTWPEALRQYLGSDPAANAEPLAILKDYQEYPVVEAKESKTFIFHN